MAPLFGLLALACSDPTSSASPGVSRRIVHLEPVKAAAGPRALELAARGVLHERLQGVDATGGEADWTELAWEAERIDRVVARTNLAAGTRARLYFRTAEDEARERDRRRRRGEAPDAEPLGFPEAQFLEARTLESGELHFACAIHPRWRGALRGLSLRVPSAARDLRAPALEAYRPLLPPGASPRPGTDLGLVSLARAGDARSSEARRAFPALTGQTLSIPIEQATERVRLSFARPPGQRPETVAFEILHREGERAQSLLKVELGPEHEGWRDASLGTSFGAGSFLELRTTVEGLERAPGAEPGAAIGPEHLEGLWGPILAELAQPLPSVLVITVDTLRADHLGSYGDSRSLTPNLDRLAAGGATFLDALSACNATSPSHASIFTGLYPKDHGVLSNRYALREEAATVAEWLRRSGRTTLSYSAVGHLNARASGLGQGVDAFVNTTPGARSFEPPPAVLPAQMSLLRTQTSGERTAPEVHRSFLEHLDSLGSSAFYAWVHLFDSHTPYVPSAALRAEHWPEPEPAGGEPFFGQLAQGWAANNPSVLEKRTPEGQTIPRTKAELGHAFLDGHPHLAFLGGTVSEAWGRAMYAAEVEELDRELGALLDGLEASGRRDELLICLTADHGESLGERDVWFDHQGVYTNTLRVPLIFSGPGVRAGVRSSVPASTVDLFPTLCELLDLAPPAFTAGRSLADALAGASLPERRRWFQASGAIEAGYRGEEHHAILSTTYHRRGTFGERVEEGALELYAWPGDPALEEDLSADANHAEAGRAAAEAIRVWLADRTHSLTAERRQLDAADEASLKAFGYTGD